MQAGGNPNTVKRFLAGKSLTDLFHDRHLLPSPFNAVTASRGQLEVFDIVRDGHVLS